MAWTGKASALGTAGRGHPHAGPGLRARREARGPRGRGGRASGDPDLEGGLQADARRRDAGVRGYDWLVFTSANGVHHFFGEFFRIFDDIRSLGLIRIACVGDATARAVAELHLKVECQPKKATAEALADEMVDTGSMDSAKVLVITGNLNRDVLVNQARGGPGDRRLPAGLQDGGRGPLRDPRPPNSAAGGRRGPLRELLVGAVLRRPGGRPQDRGGARAPKNGSIGPQTSETMRKVGLRVDFEARTPGIDELVAELL
jgi:hypothetical protein